MKRKYTRSVKRPKHTCIASDSPVADLQNQCRAALFIVLSFCTSLNTFVSWNDIYALIVALKATSFYKELKSNALFWKAHIGYEFPSAQASCVEFRHCWLQFGSSVFADRPYFQQQNTCFYNYQALKWQDHTFIHSPSTEPVHQLTKIGLPIYSNLHANCLFQDLGTRTACVDLCWMQETMKPLEISVVNRTQFIALHKNLCTTESDLSMSTRFTEAENEQIALRYREFVALGYKILFSPGPHTSYSNVTFDAAKSFIIEGKDFTGPLPLDARKYQFRALHYIVHLESGPKILLEDNSLLDIPSGFVPSNIRAVLLPGPPYSPIYLVSHVYLKGIYDKDNLSFGFLELKSVLNGWMVIKTFSETVVAIKIRDYAEARLHGRLPRQKIYNAESSHPEAVVYTADGFKIIYKDDSDGKCSSTWSTWNYEGPIYC